MLGKIRELRLGKKVRGAWPASRLGLLERWYAAQPIPRVIGLLLELARPVDHEALLTALAALESRHPDALGVTLGRGHEGESTFSPCTAELPLTRVEANDPWGLAADELQRLFPPGGLLWRVRAGTSGTCLVATFHHVIADGTSAAIFARELLALLRGDSLPAISGPRFPLDARLDTRPTLGLLLREALASRESTSFYRGPDHLEGPRTTRLTAFSLPAPLVAALRARARREHATVHAALSAAGMVASAFCARASAHSGFPLRARLLTPISLRKVAVPEPSGMGVFVCGVESNHEFHGGERFWRFAEEYARRIRTALPEGYQRLGLLRFAGDLRTLAERHARCPNARTATLEVSNLGSVDGLGDARFWFIQGNHYDGPLFNVSVVTCAESGELRAVLAVPAPVVTADLSAHFVRVFERTIAASVDSDPTLAEALSQ